MQLDWSMMGQVVLDVGEKQGERPGDVVLVQSRGEGPIVGAAAQSLR